MKHALILSAALLGLAACNGSDPAPETPAGTQAQDAGDTPAPQEADFRADCLVVANDVEGRDEIAGMGTDAEGFCACAEEFVAAMPEADQAKAKTTMNKVAAGMTETGQETEDVVSAMMAEAMGMPDDPDAQATAEGVEIVGQMIDDIGNSFENTGSCTVS